MARPDTIREQLRETQREFSAAVLAGDEIAAAGEADMYRALSQWAAANGIAAPPLRMPAQPRPEPPAEPTDPLRYEMTAAGPAYLLPGIEPAPSSAGQTRLF